jgi:hypothetical protein
MSVLIFIDRSSLTALNEILRTPACLAELDAFQASCRRSLLFGRHVYETFTITRSASLVKKYVLIFHEFAKNVPSPLRHTLARLGGVTKKRFHVASARLFQHHG